MNAGLFQLGRISPRLTFHLIWKGFVLSLKSFYDTYTVELCRITRINIKTKRHEKMHESCYWEIAYVSFTLESNMPAPIGICFHSLSLQLSTQSQHGIHLSTCEKNPSMQLPVYSSLSLNNLSLICVLRLHGAPNVQTETSESGFQNKLTILCSENVASEIAPFTDKF